VGTNLAVACLYHDRKSKLKDFKKVIEGNSDERFWQKFLKENAWMLGNECAEILGERRVYIEHETDFPVRTDGGFMDIVEIKKPSLPFWTLSRDGKHFKYRGKFLVPHHELQGALPKRRNTSCRRKSKWIAWIMSKRMEGRPAEAAGSGNIWSQ
jgi:hypothetical protein